VPVRVDESGPVEPRQRRSRRKNEKPNDALERLDAMDPSAERTNAARVNDASIDALVPDRRAPHALLRSSPHAATPHHNFTFSTITNIGDEECEKPLGA